MFKLEIETTNAAFKDDGSAVPGSFEIAEILQQAARQLNDGEPQGDLYDSNGNKVGRFALTED